MLDSTTHRRCAAQGLHQENASPNGSSAVASDRPALPSTPSPKSHTEGYDSIAVEAYAREDETRRPRWGAMVIRHRRKARAALRGWLPNVVGTLARRSVTGGEAALGLLDPFRRRGRVPMDYLDRQPLPTTSRAARPVRNRNLNLMQGQLEVGEFRECPCRWTHALWVNSADSRSRCPGMPEGGISRSSDSAARRFWDSSARHPLPRNWKTLARLLYRARAVVGPAY